MENLLKDFMLFLSFSKWVFGTSQALAPLFHGFHTPYYYY